MQPRLFFGGEYRVLDGLRYLKKLLPSDVVFHYSSSSISEATRSSDVVSNQQYMTSTRVRYLRSSVLSESLVKDK